MAAGMVMHAYSWTLRDPLRFSIERGMKEGQIDLAGKV